MKKATRTLKPRINANIYEGSFDIGFDCPGATRCYYALGYVMPPEEDSVCSFYDCSCTSPLAKIAAMESLQRRIAKELKQLKEEISE
jgi:hypothetical protein